MEAWASPGDQIYYHVELYFKQNLEPPVQLGYMVAKMGQSPALIRAFIKYLNTRI